MRGKLFRLVGEPVTQRVGTSEMASDQHKQIECRRLMRLGVNVCFDVQERSGSEAGDVSGGTPRSARSQQGGKGGAVASTVSGGKTLWKG